MQHPRIAEQLAIDIHASTLLAMLLEAVAPNLFRDMRPIVRELAEITRGELDFAQAWLRSLSPPCLWVSHHPWRARPSLPLILRCLSPQEASNQTLAARALGGSGLRVRVPTVFPQLVTRRLLAMEYVDGVKLTQASSQLVSE